METILECLDRAGFPKAFVAHGPGSLHYKLIAFLFEWDICPLYDGNSLPPGVDINTGVEAMIEAADVAIVLVNPDDRLADGTSYPRRNVTDELARCQRKFGPERTLVLMERSVPPHSNINGRLHLSFTGEAVEETFPRLLLALRRLGLLEGARGPWPRTSGPGAAAETPVAEEAAAIATASEADTVSEPRPATGGQQHRPDRRGPASPPHGRQRGTAQQR